MSRTEQEFKERDEQQNDNIEMGHEREKVAGEGSKGQEGPEAGNQDYKKAGVFKLILQRLKRGKKARGQDLTQMTISKSIIVLAIPVILRMTLQMIVGVVDLAMVGRLGSAAIAAVGMSNQLMWFIISATTAFSVGTTAMVARFIGAKKRDLAEEVAKQSVAITFVIATFIAILGFIFARPIFGFMIILMERADPAVLDAGQTFFRILALSFPFFFSMMVINGIMQGSGDTVTPLKVNALANVINIVGDYVLIFGVGPFPELGIAGAAIATAFSRSFAAVVGFSVLVRGNSELKIHLSKKFRFNWHLIKEVAGIGVPAAAEQLIRNSGTTIMTMIVASFGTVALAANQIVMRGISIANMPGFGFGMAATTLVGQNLGAKQPERAEESGMTANKMGVTFMVVMASLIFLGANQIAAFFTPDPDVIKLAARSMRIIAVALPFLSITLTLAGGLRGAGDTKWVMYITAIGVWFGRVGAAILLAKVIGLGFMGVWVAMGFDWFVRSMMTLGRFKTGNWKKIKLHQEQKQTA
ncbi:MAG: MATE family efflux transporter [Halanaerobium sp.]|nr:MATE family efflux transporter [Halanaerobium sp.]